MQDWRYATPDASLGPAPGVGQGPRYLGLLRWLVGCAALAVNSCAKHFSSTLIAMNAAVDAPGDAPSSATIASRTTSQTVSSFFGVIHSCIIRRIAAPSRPIRQGYCLTNEIRGAHIGSEQFDLAQNA